MSHCWGKVWSVWARDTGLSPTPTFSKLKCIFLLCLYVCPRHAHSIDTEPCGRVTLSCQLWSTLCWSGAAAQYHNQGQGSLTAGCSGTHLNANRHKKWMNKYIFPPSLKKDFYIIKLFLIIFGMVVCFLYLYKFTLAIIVLKWRNKII